MIEKLKDLKQKGVVICAEVLKRARHAEFPTTNMLDGYMNEVVEIGILISEANLQASERSIKHVAAKTQIYREAKFIKDTEGTIIIEKLGDLLKNVHSVREVVKKHQSEPVIA